MIRVKIMIVSLLLIVTPLLVFASGHQESASQTSHGTTQVLWWSPNWVSGPAHKLASAFMSKHPGIKVNIQEQVWTGMLNKITVALQANNAPDVVDVAVAWNRPLAEQGLLLGLTNSYASSSFPRKDFLPAQLGTAELNGQLYGVPYRVDGEGLFYNKTEFKNAGLNPNKPPRNLKELVADAKKLTRGTVYGFAFPAGESSNMMFAVLKYVWAEGGHVLTADGKKAAVDSPEFVNAIQSLCNMVQKEKIVPPSVVQYNDADINKLFASGQIAMIDAGAYVLSTIQKENPQLQVGTAPVPAPLIPVASGWNFVIPKRSAHPKQAWSLVTFLTQPDNMVTYTPDNYPARYSAYQTTTFQSRGKLYKDLRPRTGEKIGFYPSVPQWPQIKDVLFQQIQSALMGRETAKQALTNAANSINGILG